jgi:hypothetical protein
MTVSFATRVICSWAIAFILLSSGLVDAQYYMYTPGSSILPYMNSQFDTYGCGL